MAPPDCDEPILVPVEYSHGAAAAMTEHGDACISVQRIDCFEAAFEIVKTSKERLHPGKGA
jgi:hypothetical protein